MEAAPREMKSAYKKLSVQFHPDKNHLQKEKAYPIRQRSATRSRPNCKLWTAPGTCILPRQIPCSRLPCIFFLQLGDSLIVPLWGDNALESPLPPLQKLCFRLQTCLGGVLAQILFISAFGGGNLGSLFFSTKIERFESCAIPSFPRRYAIHHDYERLDT